MVHVMGSGMRSRIPSYTETEMVHPMGSEPRLEAHVRELAVAVAARGRRRPVRCATCPGRQGASQRRSQTPIYVARGEEK